MLGKQIRNFVFTCNNYKDNDIDKIKELPDDFECNYYIYGKEKGASGTPHLQGYAELSKRVSFNKIRKHLKGFHIEDRKGTSKEAIDYCSKDNDCEIYGSPKISGQRTDLATLKNLLLASSSMKKLLETDGINFNYQSLRFAENLLTYYEQPRRTKPYVEWFFGSSGIGKTRKAVEILPNAYFKPTGSGRWWPGYDGETEVIIDDVDSTTYSIKYLLTLLDRYPCVVETKGGTRQFQGTHIIVTSLCHPESEFMGGELVLKQLTRRIDNLVHLK